MNAELPILDLLAGPWETKEFPVDLCFIPNERDNWVGDAPHDIVFLCLVVDRNERGSAWLELLRPYTSPRPRQKRPWNPNDPDAYDRCDVFHHWTAVNGEGHVDHFENSGPSEFTQIVVAWRQVPPGTDILALSTR